MPPAQKFEAYWLFSSALPSLQNHTSIYEDCYSSIDKGMSKYI